jgi:diaminopropionate ammonia-lyase
MAVPDASAIDCMRVLAAGSPPVVAGESAVAGLAGLLLAAREPYARAALALGEESRVLLFGTEGATDPELYTRLVGAQEVGAQEVGARGPGAGG